MTILKIVVLGIVVIGVLQLPIKYLKAIGLIAWAAFSLLGCLAFLHENFDKFGTYEIIIFSGCAFLVALNTIAFIGKPACLGGNVLAILRKRETGNPGVSTDQRQPINEYREKNPKGMKALEWTFVIALLTCCILPISGISYTLNMIFPNSDEFSAVEWGTSTIMILGVGLACTRLPNRV